MFLKRVGRHENPFIFLMAIKASKSVKLVETQPILRHYLSLQHHTTDFDLLAGQTELFWALHRFLQRSLQYKANISIEMI